MSDSKSSLFDRSVLERLSDEELSLELAEESAELSYEMLRQGVASMPVGPVASFVMERDGGKVPDFSGEERMAPFDPSMYGSAPDAYDVSDLPF